MKDIRAKILSNEEIAPGYFRMGIEASFIARNATPGQFVQIRCSDALDPLLRRPFSIHRLPSTSLGAGKAPLDFARGRQGSPRLRSGQARLKGFELLYEVVGKGTGLLSNKKRGDFLDVLGPLGNGFPLPPSTIHHPPSTILIAGGIGVAPLLFLAEVLLRQKTKVTVLLGAKTKKTVLCERDFKKSGCEVFIATDDGTRGCKGTVSVLLQRLLRTTKRGSRTTIYACGPLSMLRCIAGICRDRKMQCQVSLEEKMACGFGACLGCAVKVRSQKFGYKLACKDGPIFNADDIVWK